jgi:hypothetical protein
MPSEGVNKGRGAPVSIEVPLSTTSTATMALDRSR